MLTFPCTLYFPPLMDTHETEYLEHLWLSSCLRPHCCSRISLKDLAESLHSNNGTTEAEWIIGTGKKNWDAPL